MAKLILCILAGYLSGSLLWAKFFGYLFAKEDITRHAADGNPGTYNAFACGGVLCGCLTLCADLLKGFLPVFLYGHMGPPSPPIGLSLVLAAPVFGHGFSVFHRFRGGKGVAVSFGCLLGLLPDLRPVLVLVTLFLLFSLVVKISPHFHRTLFTYLFAALVMLRAAPRAVAAGFLLIAAVVLLKLHMSTEPREKCEVTFGWKS